MKDDALAATESRGDGGSSLTRLFEGLLVVLLLFALGAACALAFVLATGLLEPSNVIADDVLRERVFGVFETGTLATRALIAVVSLLLGLAVLAVLVGKLPGRGPSPTAGANHVVSADDEGMVVIASEGVESLVKLAATRTHGVIDAHVSVRGRGASPVGIRIKAITRPGTDMSRCGKELRDAARTAVERLGGLTVADVVVKLDVMSPDKMGLRTL